MCEEDAILLEEDSINQSTYKPGEEFNVTLRVKFIFLDYMIRTFQCLDQSLSGSIDTMYDYSCG